MTNTKISAINPYVNDVRDTDPMISRVPMQDLGIGARPGTLKTAYSGGSAEMAIAHVGGGTKGGK